MRVVVVYDPDGDWEALYVNGALKEQGHAVSIDTALRAVGVEAEFWERPTDDRYPERLEEIQCS